MSLFESTRHIENCPECQAPLQIKRGKQGLFLGCSRYPDCQYLKPLQQSYRVIKTLPQNCPQCDGALQLKQGSFGIFIGCANYPDCHFIVQEETPAEEIFDCPECGTHQLIARTGRNGKLFYGCRDYPKCKFTLPSKPIKMVCPECQCDLATLKKQRGKSIYQCANRQCQHLFSETE